MKTSPCGGILGSCIGFVGRNTTAGMPPAFFAPPPHICPLQGRSAKFGRICSDARRLRRRQGVPLFQSQPTQCGANGRNWPAFSYITAPLSAVDMHALAARLRNIDETTFFAALR